MPYDFVGHRCNYCGAELWVERPFCFSCGSKLTSNTQEEYAFLLTSGDINEELRHAKGWPAKLWNYWVSHSELEIRLENDSSKNLHLKCAGVTSLEFPSVNWDADLKIVEIKNNNEFPQFVVQDPSIGVKVRCWSVRLFFDLPPITKGAN